jgi:hypothetical protein
LSMFRRCKSPHKIYWKYCIFGSSWQI